MADGLANIDFIFPNAEGKFLAIVEQQCVNVHLPVCGGVSPLSQLWHIGQGLSSGLDR